MSLSLDLDAHLSRSHLDQLELRQIDVLAVYDDDRSSAPDEEIVERAIELGRIVVTFDEDYLAIAADLQRSSREFPGIVYAHHSIPIGRCLHDLELIAKCYEPEDMRNRVEYLPL